MNCIPYHISQYVYISRQNIAECKVSSFTAYMMIESTKSMAKGYARITIVHISVLLDNIMRWSDCIRGFRSITGLNIHLYDLILNFVNHCRKRISILLYSLHCRCLVPFRYGWRSWTISSFSYQLITVHNNWTVTVIKQILTLFCSLTSS
jgi:hypothetical protein